MELFTKDEQGQYTTATTPVIIREGRTRTLSALKKGVDIIGNSQAAKEAIASKIFQYQHEVFGCLFLDTKNCILAWKEMFRGTIDHNSVHPREVVREALRLNASKVIIAHNHPSGNTDPSLQDIELTCKLKEILKVIDVTVLDHIVVGDEILSFTEKGLCVD